MGKLAVVVQTTEDKNEGPRVGESAPSDLEYWTNTLLRWFENSETACIILTDEGRFVSANATGRALLAEEAVLRITEGRVHAVCSKDASGLGAALRSGRPSALLLEAPATRDIWFLRATPGAGLMMCELRKARPQAPQACLEIMQAFGLTPAERRMLQHLLTVSSIEEIARTEGISVETVRTHRKRAFGKVGVATRFELAELVLRSAL